MKFRGADVARAAVVSALLVSAGAARGRDLGGSARPPERPDDAYVPVAAGARLTSPAATAVAGSFVSIQVNVDADGNNIVGDAGNEPSLAIDPTAPNRMAIGWRQFDTIASNFRQAGYSFSRDGGRTWAELNIIEPGLFRSDPVLEAGPDGTFYYLSLRVNQKNQFFTTMFISADAGATWPVGGFAFGGDKQWFAIDSTGGMGHTNVYQAWNTAGNQFFPAQFNRSTNAGISWSTPVEFDPNFIAFPVFGLVAVGPDGAVYVAGSENSQIAETFWVVRSSNAQDDSQVPTFEQITEIDMGGDLLVSIGSGPNPGGLLGQVNVAVDHSGGTTHGNVYVLGSIDPPGPDPMDIHFIRSEDGGATFSSPVTVNDDGPSFSRWQWFGQMSVAPNGRIDVVWNDTRNSGLENISELFYSFSTDGGRTWEPNVPVSPSFNSHVGWPNQSKLGDYYDLASDNVGASLAWAATFNGEQDVYFLRIGDYDCNSNSVPDANDIADETSGDCNANGIPDECEIAAGTSADDNNNGIPDECECPWDCDGSADGAVNVSDLLALLAQYDPQSPANCTGGSCDFNGDGCVDVTDLLKLLAHYDPAGQGCPQ